MLDIVGSGKIELFDERSIRKLDEIPFKNILLRGGIEWAKWHARRDYSYPQDRAYYSGDTFRYARDAGYDGRPYHPLGIIAVTTDARVPSVDENLTAMTTIGYADKSIYSGSDAKRGTPNYAECEQDPSHVRWVFDWPTSAGNGTFRSVWWYYSQQSTDWPITLPYEYNRGAVGPFSGSNGLYQMVYDASNGALYGTSFDGSGRVSRTAWGDGVSQVGSTGWTTSFRTNNFTYGITLIGSELFTLGYNNNVVRVYDKTLNLGDVTATPIRSWSVAGVSGSSDGTITTDGTNLYLGWSGATTGAGKVYKYDINGNLLGSFTITNISGANSLYGIVYDATTDDLLVSQGSNIVVRYGASGGRFGVLQSFFSVPSYSYFTSGFFKDSKLWVCVPSNIVVRAPNSTASNAGARTRLPADVTKTNLQTMKISYQFDFS